MRDLVCIIGFTMEIVVLLSFYLTSYQYVVLVRFVVTICIYLMTIYIVVFTYSICTMTHFFFISVSIYTIS